MFYGTLLAADAVTHYIRRALKLWLGILLLRTIILLASKSRSFWRVPRGLGSHFMGSANL
jgi:hypothetical protein